MAQISLYIEDSMVERLGGAAKARGCSVSKYVTSLITERLSEEESDEMRKRQTLSSLKGSLKDAAFSEPPEIPPEAGIGREYEFR